MQWNEKILDFQSQLELWVEKEKSPPQHWSWPESQMESPVFLGGLKTAWPQAKLDHPPSDFILIQSSQSLLYSRNTSTINSFSILTRFLFFLRCVFQSYLICLLWKCKPSIWVSAEIFRCSQSQTVLHTCWITISISTRLPSWIPTHQRRDTLLSITV